MDYQNILTIEPGKRGGRPCVRGMRITAEDVLSYLASGMSHDEILADFPYLTAQDLRACLRFAIAGGGIGERVLRADRIAPVS